MNVMERTVKALGRRLGLEVSRHNLYTSSTAQRRRLLDVHGVETVLDVGANEGQYATELLRGGFKGRVVSFEPLSAAHAALSRNAAHAAFSRNAAGAGGWVVAPRMALGERDAEVEINVAANAVSSSVLPMRQAHVDAAGSSAYVGREKVALRRLDSAAPALGLNGRVFLKMDVQGYEMEVLKGSSGIMDKIAGMEMELSLVELYEGQRLWLETAAYLSTLGFEPHALIPCFIDEKTGRLLQMDGIFFRTGGAGRG